MISTLGPTLKVAIIINTAWNIYNFRKGIVQKLLSQGHEVVAIAPRDDYTAKLEDLGCTYKYLPISGSGINPFRDLWLIYRFWRLVASERPDVMLTYTIKPNIYGSIIRRITGVPIICNVSGLGTVFMRKGLVSTVAILLYRVSLTKADLVFFQNDEDQALFMSRVPLHKERTELLNGSGIDLKYFIPPNTRRNGTMSFLMIGRLMTEKGVYEYAEAARLIAQKHPDATFKLLGGWDQNDKRAVKPGELQRWQDDGRLSYLGTTDDVRSEIENADVVVLPSYREGTPRTLLEAGAMGRALIATDVPGCRHVVCNEVNGFLCQVKSANELAVAMEKWIKLDESAKNEMAISSRRLIEEKFDEQHVINSYIDAINKLVQRPNRGE